ncbi:MAG: PP2C family protein-serine/threonine phosphatase [Planctomycetota bacterium]
MDKLRGLIVDSTASSDGQDVGGKSLSPGIASRAFQKLGSLLVRRTCLWRDIQRFASWVESDAVVLAGQAQESRILVELGHDGLGGLMRIGAKKYSDSLDNYQLLWDFLRSLDIRRIELDSRLERNQVVDIMVLLYSYRRRLAGRHDGRNPRGIVGHLLGENGLHTACTCVSIKGETLVITYTYCTLAFSRLMRWFEQKHRNFHDHRALFHAAPRYAVLVGAIAIGPGIIYSYMHGSWHQITISAPVALLLAGLVYVFFMVAGSVEYDNEEKDYQLTKAYREVKTYAEQIKADLLRAQVIQRKFLPDLTNGQLSERINWAVSFDPVEEVGGDYYDVQALDENKIAILFSDVSGHGMAAAFVTGILKTTFASWIDSKMTLPEFVSVLNSTLCRLIPAGNFAAVFVAVYDCSTGELSYVNGGHNPQPWRIPAAEQDVISAITGGGTLLMGIDQDIDIKPARLALGAEDIILFVSDGIVENRNVETALYGTDRLEGFLEANRGRQVQELVDAIVSESQAFSKDAKQGDDRTILALQIKNQEPPAKSTG